MGDTTEKDELHLKYKLNAFESEEYYYIMYKIKSNGVLPSNKRPILEDDIISKDVSHEIMFTNLTPEDQKGLNLIKFIKEKMEKNLIFETGSLCILPTLISKNKVSRTISCFLSLINPNQELISNEKETIKYILCLITTMDNDSFSLFRDDLEKYVRKLGIMMSVDNNELELNSLEEFLSCWKNITFDYIVRGTELLDTNIDVFLHACLMGKQLQINCPSPSDNDVIKRFSELISLTNLDSSDSDDETDNQDDIETLEININEKNEVSLNTSETNDFCKNWAALLLNNKNNSVKLRTIIDQLKIRLNQDLNQIKRLVDSAIYNCYGLYEAFEYIKKSPCKDVLLVCLLKDHFNNDEARDVLEVVYNFLLEIGEVNC